MKFEFDQPDDLQWLAKIFHSAISSTERFLLTDVLCDQPMFAEYRLKLIELRRKIYSWQGLEDPNEELWKAYEKRDNQFVLEQKQSGEKFLKVESNDAVSF